MERLWRAPRSQEMLVARRAAPFWKVYHLGCWVGCKKVEQDSNMVPKFNCSPRFNYFPTFLNPMMLESCFLWILCSFFIRGLPVGAERATGYPHHAVFPRGSEFWVCLGIGDREHVGIQDSIHGPSKILFKFKQKIQKSYWIYEATLESSQITGNNRSETSRTVLES